MEIKVQVSGRKIIITENNFSAGNHKSNLSPEIIRQHPVRKYLKINSVKNYI